MVQTAHIPKQRDDVLDITNLGSVHLQEVKLASHIRIHQQAICGGTVKIQQTYQCGLEPRKLFCHPSLCLCTVQAAAPAADPLARKPRSQFYFFSTARARSKGELWGYA